VSCTAMPGLDGFTAASRRGAVVRSSDRTPRWMEPHAPVVIGESLRPVIESLSLHDRVQRDGFEDRTHAECAARRHTLQGAHDEAVRLPTASQFIPDIQLDDVLTRCLGETVGYSARVRDRCIRTVFVTGCSHSMAHFRYVRVMRVL